jgi:hypothetical protein
MNQDVSETRDLLLLHLGRRVANLVRDLLGRLSDDLEVSHDGVHRPCVVLE